jgi:hypothetical protein
MVLRKPGQAGCRAGAVEPGFAQTGPKRAVVFPGYDPAAWRWPSDLRALVINLAN